MTVAAAIAIGTGSTSTPGLDKASGAAQGVGRGIAANQDSQQQATSGAESFRAGWQSLLASLGSSMAGFSETGAEAAQGTPSAGQTLADTAGKSSVSTSIPDAGAGSRTRLEAEKGIGLPSAGLNVSQVDARAEASAAGATESASNGTEDKETSASRESESASGSRRTHSAKTSVTEVAAAVTLPDVISATTVSLSQPVPVAAVANTVAQVTDSRTQSTHAETSADSIIGSPSEFASATLSSHSLNLDQIKEVGGAVNASAQEPAEGFEKSGKQNEALSVRNSSGSSSTAIDETDASAAGESTGSQAAMRTEGGNSVQMPAQSQSLTQTPTPGQSEISAQPGSQEANILSAAIDGNSLDFSSAAANAAPSGQISAVPRTESKSSLASEKKLSASDSQQSRHGASNVDSTQHHGSLLIQGQSSGAAADASTVARAVAGAGGSTSTTGNLTDRSSTATSGPDSREAFATLDAGGTTGKPTWIHAGAQRAEAGFQDPSLGWVGVRADASGGGIHVELVPGSSDAAQTLGSHMAGLSAYLAEHHTPVETLTLTSPESSSAGLGSGTGAGDGRQQGTGQETSQGATQGSDSREQFASQTAPEVPVWTAARGGGVQATGLEGHQISVMA